MGDTSPTVEAVSALDATVAAPSTEPVSAQRARTVGNTQARTTVLPRRAQDGAGPDTKEDRRFHQVRPLGAGGMGEVTLALDEDIHRKVAIKRLRAGTTDAAALLRFADEVRTIGQLEHPSIIPVHDVGIDPDGGLYLVMKYVDGLTLEEIIAGLRKGDAEMVARFPLGQRVEIMAKMLEALAYAHERGYVHRDLKPANVMVGKHGEVTLMDWGIAKRVGTEDEVDALGSTDERTARLVETNVGSILGTPMYMSPEQAAGKNKELDARSDTFSASLLAVELFTLKHPMQDLESLTAIIATLLHKEFDEPLLRAIFVATETPAELEWFCVDGLSRDPTKRYADAGRMLGALRSLQAGVVRARCPITGTKAVVSGFNRWLDRNPNLWVGIMALTFVCMMALVVRLAWLGIRALIG